MDEIFIEKAVLRIWKTLKDPIRLVLIIMTIPTMYWLVFSVYHAWKFHRNFILPEEYYKSEEYSRIDSSPREGENRNIKRRLDNNNIEPKTKEDSGKLQILYNYYSVVTYLGNSAILAATLLATEIGVFFAYKWNRKKSAFDLYKFSDIRDELELSISLYDIESDYLSYRRKLKKTNNNSFNDSLKRTRTLTRNVLNTFELIATGIKHGVIDEEMAFDQLRFVMFAYWRWSCPYILLSRMLSVDSAEKIKYDSTYIFSEFENLIYRWQRRERQIDSKLKLEEWKDRWKDSVIEPVKWIFEEVKNNSKRG